MMAVNKALDEIKFRIPRPVLEAVFVKRLQGWRQQPVSLDEQILQQVIRPRVLVDMNLVGGTEAIVDLNGLAFERTNDYTSIYRIPKDRTQGRSIQSVLNITYSDPTKVSTYGMAAGLHNTTMLQAGGAVMDAMGQIPVTSTAKVNLIGENVVMVRDTVILPANIYLRCILENDDNLSNIQLKSYIHVSNLVTHAVKAYIYNEYVIEMDMGELHGGQSLGRFKDIIDGYADQEELYQTYLLEKWQKVALMNDGESWNRMLRQIIGGSR
jgi:hypothetical protein